MESVIANLDMSCVTDRTHEMEIDMTEQEVLAANIAALGVDVSEIERCKPFPDQILALMEAAVRKLKRPVKPSEILAQGCRLSPSGLRSQLAQLKNSGRVIALTDPRKSDQLVYLPRIV